MSSKQEEFLKALGEQVLETAGALTADSPLTYGDGAAWDSLAVVSTLAVIDEVYGASVNGQKLSECAVVGDILKLVGDV